MLLFAEEHTTCAAESDWIVKISDNRGIGGACPFDDICPLRFQTMLSAGLMIGW